MSGSSNLIIKETLPQIQKILNSSITLPQSQQKSTNSSLFMIIQLEPILTIVDLRTILDSDQKDNQSNIKVIAEKMMQLIGKIIALLEHNESCRWSWSDGDGSRLNRGSKIHFGQMKANKRQMSILIQQCRKKVESKSEFLQFLTCRHKQIFGNIQQEKSQMTNFKAIHLPDFPQLYLNVAMLEQSVYLSDYEWTLQKFFYYYEQIKKYIEKQSTIEQFRLLCNELSKSDSILLSRKRINELIKYVLYFCSDRYRKMQILKQQIKRMRITLVESTVRAYYLCFLAQKDIKEVKKVIDRVEQYVVKWVKNQKNNHIDGQNFHEINMNGTSENLLSGQLRKEKKIIQQKFNSIFTFLTDRKQLVYEKLFCRKLKKRCRDLFSIQQQIFLIEKILFNPLLGEEIINKLKLKETHSELMIARKFRQIQQMRKEFTPMNDYQFRVLFEEIQHMLVFVNEANNYEYREILQSLEQQIMKEHLYNERGSRKWNKQRLSNSMMKSRLSQRLNNSRVIKEDFFEETYREVIENAEIRNSRISITEPVQPKQIYEEAISYINSIDVEFAEELNDQSNFKVYLLPKLTNQIEQALHLTPYSQQPLHLQLIRMLKNLKQLPLIIKPELNEQNLDMILYPSINSQLFGVFRSTMIEHYRQLCKFQIDLKGQHQKKDTLFDQIRDFVFQRINYLVVLLQHIDRLEVIAKKVEQVFMDKETYELASQGTQSIVLTLLLAEKQVKALKKSLEDSINRRSLSKKAVRLITDTICPLIIMSLSHPFEQEAQSQRSNTLQQILELIELALDKINESNKYMNQAIHDLQTLRAGSMKLTFSFRQILRASSAKLSQIKINFEQIENKTNQFTGLGVQKVVHQKIRVSEFLQICEKGSQTTIQIVDERGKYFFQLVKIMKG